mgnify:CR=1 FL=1
MKKKVIYKVTTKYSIEIEVENIDEEKLIEELNKEFERQLKQDKTYHARTVSLEYLHQKYGFELADTSLSEEEIELIKQQESEKEEFNEKLNEAIEKLRPRQKEIIIKIFFEEKTQIEVAKELGVTKGCISTTLARALDNLRKYLKKF